jgi:hypothetical protein
MYFRYHVNYSSPKTKQPVGIFVAVWHLLQKGLLTEEETVEYWKTRKFAEEKLPVPPFYSEGNPRGAVTWFKENAFAEGFVAKVPFYFNMLRKYQVKVIKTKTDNPGEIIYEDDFQIAAVKE